MANKKVKETINNAETNNTAISLPTDFVPLSIEDTLDFSYAQRTGLMSKTDVDAVNELKALASAQTEKVASRAKEMLDSGDLQKYKVITLNDAEKSATIQQIVLRIEETNRMIQAAKDNYFSLLPDLGKLRMSMPEKGKIEIDGVTYKNGFKGFCMNRFGFSKSTFYNLMKILDYFYDTVTGTLVDGVAEKGMRPTLALIAALEGKAPEKKQDKKQEENKQDESAEEKLPFDENGNPAEENKEENKEENTTKIKSVKQRVFQSVPELLEYLNSEETAKWSPLDKDGYLVLTLYDNISEYDAK